MICDPRLVDKPYGRRIWQALPPMARTRERDDAVAFLASIAAAGLRTISLTSFLRKLAVAQDTGSAIVGAVRADYFVGSGDEAGEVAGRLRQSLSVWALWPR